ncbi:hypothetical protein GCM10011416_23030 [Polaribacter pacificus]|uniref:Uncharacterized protein n=1 Tax=Polaribacter pacificus TaxID=1775173 RepID=A0A917I2P2_9FLAO|nr:DUF6452 family protein [Polaribacter pacificus]GGH03483.1 hypothetical protein GCM10011416_23030 [Polaribacter pacificus]
MKKTIVALLLFTLVASSCEKDDICLEPTTPKLILRFYDNNNPTDTKTVQRLSVWAANKDTLTGYKSISTDSIALPLDINATQTIYHLKRNTVSGNKINNEYATITINYAKEEVFVSRSCGFKILFNSVNFSINNDWIQTVTPANDVSINDETKAHAQVFH